jgi:general secretion pathway protein G
MNEPPPNQKPKPVRVRDAALRHDRSVRLRCPHCRKVFPRQDRGRCPSCNQVLLIPPALREHAEQMRDRAIRIGRDRRDRLWRMRTGGSLLASRRMRRTLAIVAFVVLGVFLPLHHLLVRTNPLPPLSADEKNTRNLGVLRTALECFRRDCGRYPTDGEGLRALVQNPGVAHWRGPYLRLLMPDLWRHDYLYGCTNGTVFVASAGPDGRAGTEDDVPAPPPDLAYVQATATNAPYQARGEDTFVNILTRPPVKPLRQQSDSAGGQ